MASNIKFKRSAVQNRVPTTAQLDLGELALNTYDGKLYTEINTGSAAVVEIGSKLSSLVVDGANGAGGGDVKFHGQTTGRDLTWDYSDNSLLLPDNVKLKIGSGGDLQFYHDFSLGSENSHISQKTSKHLVIDATTSIFMRVGSVWGVQNASGSEDFIRCNQNADVKLYFNDLERIATTNDGADIFGTGSLKVPVGTTAQRNSSPAAGDIRYNSTLGAFEGYSSSWGELGGGGIGIGSTAVNPASGLVTNRIGVGFTDINVVGTGISVTGYGSTIVLDFNDFRPGSFNRSIHNYTATAGQTTFAGLSYDNAERQIAVYLNGARLSEATYTATSGTTVVLDVGASVGDEVEIINININSDVDRNVNTYTATAGQTTFTGLSYNSITELDVYLNGIRLATGDFTATTGNTVVLNVGASVNDIVDIVSTGDGVSFRSTADTSGDKFTLTNVGIGTDITPDKLNVRGNVNIVGVLTATTLHGDGSNLTNTGSTLSEPSSGTQRLVTTSLTTGTMTSSGTGSELTFDYANNLLKLTDSTKINLGTGGDLFLFHDGSNSFLQDAGTGTLFLDCSQTQIKKFGSNHVMANFIGGGAVQLYHNNSKKFETTANGASISNIPNNQGLDLNGDGNNTCVRFMSTGSSPAHSYRVNFHSPTGTLFNSPCLSFDKTDTSGNFSGHIAGISDDGFHLADDKKLHLGSSGSAGDLQIYHDGSHSFIDDTGTGNLKLRSNNFRVSNADESKLSATFVPSGAVELYHNDSKKFETTSTGASITGNLAVSGVLTYDDVTNVDSVGIITARQGVHIDDSITHIGDTDTKIRFPTANKISLEAGGTTRIQTTSTGAQIDTTLLLHGAAGNPGRLRLQEGGALSEIMVARNTDNNSFLYFKTEISGTTATRVVIDESGHFRPFVDSAYDLGITGTRWRNVYADTLHATTLGSTLSYTSNTARLQFTNSTFGTSLHIGGYDGGTNSSNISRIRTSTGNLHIDSASNGNLYLNHYSTGSVYARQGIVWTTANDGSGSGLDADTLDGQHGSYYAVDSTAVKEILTDDDITSRMDSGFYETSSATTAEGWPETTNGHFHLIASTHSNTGNYHSLQIASPFSNQTKFYIRTTGNSGTQAWSKIWTSSSDGSGSGLDADTVDGIEGANFLRSDTADTASGDITFSGGSGAITLAANSDITFGTTGTWSGEKVKLQHHASNLYIQGGTGGINLRGSDAGTMAHFGNTATTLYDPVTFSGGAGAVTITSSDIRSSGTSTWTGNPGSGVGKIQMHSDRWYIVSGSNSNRIVQFRQDGADKTWIANDGQIYHGSSASTDKYWRQGNDGSGSGLDADTLDGVQGSSFLRSDTNDTFTGTLTYGGTGTALNFSSTSEVILADHSSNSTPVAFDIRKSGNSMSNSTTFGVLHLTRTNHNNSSTNAGAALHFRLKDSGGTVREYAGISGQKTEAGAAGGQLEFYRYGRTVLGYWNASGLYIGGNKVWHAGNDGSGSGLDADLLDGSEKSAFVLNNQNSGYVLKFGSGSNTGNTSTSFPYAIFQEGGAWSSPYPDLRINYHTGIVIAVGAAQYDGLRFQRDYNDTTELMSIGDGDNHTRIAYNLQVSGDIQANGGAGAVTIGGGSDIRLTSGNWTGDAYGKIQHHNNHLYFGGGSSADYSFIFRYNNSDKVYIKNNGTIWPQADNTSDLGTTSNRWRNIYTNDLNLSNEGVEGGNDVDGTWGDWTLQEGEEEIFMINNRTGKKYAMMLREVA